MIILDLKDDRSEKIPYDYPDYPIHARRLLLSSYPHFMAPSHWHDDVEFIKILSGSVVFNVNGKAVPLREGEGIFVNARQMHFFFSPSCQECVFLCVVLHPDLLCASPSCERDYVLPLLTREDWPFLHLRPEEPWQQKILVLLEDLPKAKNKKAGPLHAVSAFMDIWALLFENTPPAGKIPARQNGDLEILKNMVAYIRQNYGSRLSLASIAAAGSVGQSKCCRLFSRYLGQTPGLYLTHYRLSQSMELLQNTDKTITQIAHETGFGSGSYFSETFRKWMGKSPTSCRKLN